MVEGDAAGAGVGVVGAGVGVEGVDVVAGVVAGGVDLNPPVIA